MRLFHTTQSAERFLAEGFRDVLGPFEFVHRTHYGVFVASSPAYVDEDPRERQVLEITLPDHMYLDEYAIIEAGRPVTEWCMPAALLNRYAQVRLLDQPRSTQSRRSSSWATRRDQNEVALTRRIALTPGR